MVGRKLRPAIRSYRLHDKFNSNEHQRSASGLPFGGGATTPGLLLRGEIENSRPRMSRFACSSSLGTHVEWKLVAEPLHGSATVGASRSRKPVHQAVSGVH